MGRSIPDEPFFAGEQVNVYLSHDLAAADGSPMRQGGYSYQFWSLYWPNLPRVLRDSSPLTVGGESKLTLGGIARQIIMIPGLIKLDAYSQLVDYLVEGLGYESGKDLLQFPYDWRQDNRHSAARMKEAIDDRRHHGHRNGCCDRYDDVGFGRRG